MEEKKINELLLCLLFRVQRCGETKRTISPIFSIVGLNHVIFVGFSSGYEFRGMNNNPNAVNVVIDLRKYSFKNQHFNS